MISNSLGLFASHMENCNRKLTDTKPKVLEKPLNLPLVSSYLYTQHGHLSAVHDSIFN